MVTVCVTGASGYIGSWLVMRLLERGYYVRATVRDPGNVKKVKHLLELPYASTNLSLWKADLAEESSYDDALQGCDGLFHVAAPMELLNLQEQAGAEGEIESKAVNDILNIMRSCSKVKTVKRFIYTSSVATITMQRNKTPLYEYNESHWSDVEFCYNSKMFGWMYVVAKTSAEKAAWEYAEKNGIDMISILPSLVLGHFINPSISFSVEVAIAIYTAITSCSKDESTMAFLKRMNATPAVHVDDVCNAQIHLFEHPHAKGRYICSSHTFDIRDIAHSLSLKYPDKNIQTEFEGLNEDVPCSSRKLMMETGFEFAHKNKDVGDLCAETVESCRAKGLL